MRMIAGAMVKPKRLWNQTERQDRRLDSPTEVLDVKLERGCQSGVMLKVKTVSGQEVWLDSHWFEDA